MRVRLPSAALLFLAATTAAAAGPSPQRKPAPSVRPVTVSELQGTWAFDLEASVTHVRGTLGLPAEATGKLRSLLEKYRRTTYAFSGNVIEVRGSPAGDSKGTYRVDGADLVISHGHREERLQAGLKGRELILSVKGVGSIYRRR